MEKNLKVLFVAAELNPIAKVGGLADVIGALPKALKKLGVDVRIAIPKYGIVDEKKYPLKKIAERIIVRFNSQNESITLYETPLPDTDVPVYLFDNLKYLGENGVYYEKDASPGGSLRENQRFTFYVKSSLEFFKNINWWPDIIHFHDWHVGILPVLLKLIAKKDERYTSMKTLLTIHNMAYQGKYSPQDVFKNLELSENDYPTLRLRTGENKDINYLQQAILSADLINTVSPTYAYEILTPEFGEGLEDILKSRKSDLFGVLNGIDTERFNPQKDKDIIANYKAQNLDGKKKCKIDLQKICGLKINENIPVLGIVSRLTDQKGIDILHEILPNLMATDLQLIILGTGSAVFEQIVSEDTKKYSSKMFSKIAFDAQLAQKIYAGSDIFLMPSKFEPCGLCQMIAMRYGTIPVVRATGGLKDTVANYDPQTEEGDGFVFQKYQAKEFMEAIKKALAIYQESEKWYKLVRKAMQKDFSWEASAKKYLGLYYKILEN